MARPSAQALGQFFSIHSTRRAPPRLRVQSVASVAGLRFAIPRPTLADVHVVDSVGRRVRTLVCGELSAGEHECGWNGLDDAGDRCPAGSYVLRLETSGKLLTSRVFSLS